MMIAVVILGRKSRKQVTSTGKQVGLFCLTLNRRKLLFKCQGSCNSKKYYHSCMFRLLLSCENTVLLINPLRNCQLSQYLICLERFNISANML